MRKSIFMAVVSFVLGVLAAQFLLGTGLSLAATEQLSPSDRISEEQIKVYDEYVILDVEGVEWASFVDSNSMDPFLDSGANALQIVPKSPSDIQVGDIITYKPGFAPRYVIHRVIHIDEDEHGIYYIVKGDNNKVADPGKIRFKQIDRVLFGIIY